MRATLLVLNEELIRLKAAGVTTVAVSDASLATLRRLVGQSAKTPPTGETQPAAPAPPAPPAAGGGSPSATVAKPAAPAQASPPALPSPPSVDLPPGDKPTRWAALKHQVETDEVCQRSVRPGKKVVLGVGDLDSAIFFCGEAPGGEEELAGEPFVGPAGQLLTKMIGAMGLSRAQVYLGNIMNWRPQIPTADDREQVGNRPPTAEEMAYCLPYLRAQLAVVQPRVIVALGATAAKGLLGQDRFKALGEIRGKWQQFADIPVMVTYHPSYILRNQSLRSKRAIWEDLLQVMERVELPISDKQQHYFLSK